MADHGEFDTLEELVENAAYNSRKCITRHKELNIMKGFNNAKMTEEELDQVAGGQKYIVLDRQAGTKRELCKYYVEYL